MRTAHIRITALLSITALSACSGGGGAPLSPIPQHAPSGTSSAPPSASSQTRATFVVHWPSAAEATARTKRRDTISVSTQSISVSVNGGPQTVVNKPTLSGSPSSTKVSIPAPAGNDSFAFTAWDEVNGTGNILDQATTSQIITADTNNTVTVSLDGVCAALVPTLVNSGVYIQTQNTTVPLASGSRTVLKSARLLGNSQKEFQFTRVDADGNTILTSAGTAPISVAESGPTQHVTIAPVASGVSNTMFNIAAIAAEPDGFSTNITASSPNCGPGTASLPNSFALSTSAEIVVADFYAGVLAFDQDGTPIATLASTSGIAGLAYNSKSNYLVTTTANGSGGNAPYAFQTFSTTGSSLGSGSFTPSGETSSCGGSSAPLYYNAATGLFEVADAGGNMDDGTGNEVPCGQGAAIYAYSISGSTAQQQSVFAANTSPNAMVVLPNGDTVISEEAGESGSLNLYNQTGTVFNTLTQNQSFSSALTLDSLRGNVISQDNDYPQSGTATFPGGIISYKDNVLSVSEFPLLPITSYQVFAYNPGNDELYEFMVNDQAAGISGAAIYQGGSATSNLSRGAFPGLYFPRQAVVIP